MNTWVKLILKNLVIYLVGIATEYNNALLVIENASIGWNTIQTVIDRGYQNLYYSPKGGNVTSDSYFNEYIDTSKMTPGFTMSSRTRPICINKFQEAIADKGVVIRSSRLISEMKVFVWRHGKAEAQQGYNDDLVLSFSIGQYVRDTAFKYNKNGIDLTKSMLNNTSTSQQKYLGGYSANSVDNPWKMDNPYSKGEDDIRWLL